MAVRTPEKQSQHDAVINDLAHQYQRSNWTVRTNPGGQKTSDITWWIDVMVAATPTSENTFAIEIETDDTVSEEEATSQWTGYARNYRNWYLAVPSGSETRARSLLGSHGIANCKVVTWAASSRGCMFYGLPGA